ncbi:sensor histidine kinase [Taibaiella koreensis]|uniref:sensor histidine kinase n=1 Tax=Taibaiella koreensis TaxID=1268548 RepID=UPI000E5A09BA|nr:histidine kinase [Taibaiella koreensis]
MPSYFNTLNVKLSAAIILLTISTAQFYWLCAFKGFPVDIALADALGSNLLLYGIFLFLEYGFSHYVPPIARYGIIAAQSFGFCIAWLLLCQWTLKNSFDNKAYTVFWNDTFYIRGLIGWILLCDYNLINYFVRHLSNQDSLSEQEQHSLQLRKEAELFKLRQQLHPHFLFNSLNSINALIGKEPKHARTMVQQLSEFLRHTLKKEDNDLITIQEELEDLRIYLSIEQVRFGHRLTIEEHIHTDCMEARIPPFLLQPLVENAIKYGLYGTTGPVTIYIKGTLTQDQFLFSIVNPYDPDAVTTKGTGFGLESVRRRLYLLFARNDLLVVQSQPPEPDSDPEHAHHHFTATISIPVTLPGNEQQPVTPTNN